VGGAGIRNTAVISNQGSDNAEGHADPWQLLDTLPVSAS